MGLLNIFHPVRNCVSIRETISNRADQDETFCHFYHKRKIDLSVSKSSEGFTLIEILIVISLLVIIMSLGLIISFDIFKTSSFRSEKSIVVSVLQRARAKSLNNINEKRHGVRFETNPLRYIIFECSGCTAYPGASGSDETIESSGKNYSITQPSVPFDVVFEQLSGDCVSSNCSTSLSITIRDAARIYTININKEGRIDW